MKTDELTETEKKSIENWGGNWEEWDTPELRAEVRRKLVALNRADRRRRVELRGSK